MVTGSGRLRALGVCLGLLVFPPGAWSLPADDAFAYINTLRVQAGMLPLTRDGVLDSAAEGHSSYQEAHGQSGHYQDPNAAYFTGETPGERAVNAGYPSSRILENVAAGQSDAGSSVDDLMSAIYHRFSFLNEEIDRIGVGLVEDAASSVTRLYSTYDMANQGVALLCQGDEVAVPGSYVGGVCADSEKWLLRTDYDAALSAVATANPSLVLWPTPGALDVPPVFFEESPDPLPDYSVSGYPVSLKFNAYRVVSADVISLRLFNDETGTELGDTRTIDAGTDVNHSFTAWEFALFPLQRLEWNTRYRVQAQIVTDGVASNEEWTFTTRDLGVPTYTIDGDHEIVDKQPGQDIALYVRPRSGLTDGGQQNQLGPLTISYPDGTHPPSIARIDGNTLRIAYDDPVDGNQAFFEGGYGAYNFSVRIRYPDANVGLSMSVDEDRPVVDSVVAFTLTVSNAGPRTATGVVVVDALPGDLVHVSDDGQGSYDPTSGRWTVGDLGHGASSTLRITARVEGEASLTNSAGVTADQPDPDTGDNNASVTIEPLLADGDVAPLGARDGKVSVADALVTLRYALGLITPIPADDLKHADVAPLGADRKPAPDGKVSVADALVVLRKALGLVDF